jgi:hypothetical protein
VSILAIILAGVTDAASAHGAVSNRKRSSSSKRCSIRNDLARIGNEKEFVCFLIEFVDLDGMPRSSGCRRVIWRMRITDSEAPPSGSSARRSANTADAAVASVWHYFAAVTPSPAPVSAHGILPEAADEELVPPQG